MAVIQFRARTFEAGTEAISQHYQNLSNVGFQDAPIDRILCGTWHREHVVVVRTAPEVWEIHCHGGMVAVAEIARQLRETVGRSQQSTPTLSVDSGPPPDELDAQIFDVLTRTRTLRTAAHVLAQTQGRLRASLKSLVTEMSSDRLRDLIDNILQWTDFARHLTEPWRILLLGPPNVGKSSLVNALAGFDRTIVSEQPGTTRDLVEVPMILSQWPLTICDSAGVRSQPTDPIEQAGIEAAVAAARSCDICLLVCDASRSDTHNDWISPALQQGVVPDAVVINKCDLTGPGNSRPPPRNLSGRPVIETSALTGQGIRQLSEWLVSHIVPVEPELGTPLPATEPLLQVLRTLRASLHNPQRLAEYRNRLNSMLVQRPVNH